jgi:hypothetical protein
MKEQKNRFLSLGGVNKMTEISEIDILREINKSTSTSVYRYISSEGGEWSRAGETISMGNYEGYLEVPSEHLKSAYHHLLNSVEPKPFPFLICNPKSMSIFGCGSLEALDYSIDGQSTLTHSWRCINKDGVFDKIRVMSRTNLSSHDFSVDELQAERREIVQVDSDELLEAEYVLAIEGQEDDDESIEFADALEIEANRTLQIASTYIFADYLPSSSETFIFDFSNLYLDRQDVLELFPQKENKDDDKPEEDSKTNHEHAYANTKNLELLVCDLVLIFLKMSSSAVTAEQAKNSKDDENLMIKRFMEKFKGLVQKDSSMSKNAFLNLFGKYILGDLGCGKALCVRAKRCRCKKKYSFPKLLSEILGRNEEHLDDYSLITKPPESDKD